MQHPGTYEATDGGDWASPLVYSRYKNPNIEATEATLALVEGAESAVLFGSGMAAMHALFLHGTAHVDKGASRRVAVASQIYGGTTAMLVGPLAELGFELVPFDVEDHEDLARVLDAGVELVHIEGISNPTVIVAEIDRIADQAHRAGVRLSVDSTFATPIVQRPLELGADLVMHSATKALGGHSDITAGVVLGNAGDMAKVAAYRKVTGAILDPASAWLLDRSLSTVDLRVRAQCRSARALAEALEGHPGVEKVHYPGLASSPSHARAGSQLRDGLFGSMLAFELRAGDSATRDYVGRLGLAIDAPSLGGVETLVSIPAYMSHVGLTPAGRQAAGIGPGCVRIAAGIEDPEDLVADFLQAF